MRAFEAEIDLEAERAAFLERRARTDETRILEGRARQVLRHAGWRAGRPQLEEAACELYPRHTEEQHLAMLAAALRLQKDESARGIRVAVDQVVVVPPPREIDPPGPMPAAELDPIEEELTIGVAPDDELPADPLPAPTNEQKEEHVVNAPNTTTGATRRRLTEQENSAIRLHVLRCLEENPEIAATRAHATLAAATGVTVSASTFHTRFWEGVEAFKAGERAPAAPSAACEAPSEEPPAEESEAVSVASADQGSADVDTHIVDTTQHTTARGEMRGIVTADGQHRLLIDFVGDDANAYALLLAVGTRALGVDVARG